MQRRSVPVRPRQSSVFLPHWIVFGVLSSRVSRIPLAGPRPFLAADKADCFVGALTPPVVRPRRWQLPDSPERLLPISILRLQMPRGWPMGCVFVTSPVRMTRGDFVLPAGSYYLDPDASMSVTPIA